LYYLHILLQFGHLFLWAEAIVSKIVIAVCTVDLVVKKFTLLNSTLTQICNDMADFRSLMSLPNKKHSISKTPNTNFIPFLLSYPHVICGLELAQYIGTFPDEQSWVKFAGGRQNFYTVNATILCNSGVLNALGGVTEIDQ
jgi:hypothetical protein